MVRSLWNAATGMNGQQMNIDTISNNLSNVNTTGLNSTVLNLKTFFIRM